MRVRAILNPRAGIDARRAAEVVRLGCPQWTLETVHTAGAGDATRLAREATAAGVEMVLAVGGDGTANEVAAGLAGSATALGIVPAGSGNGFARMLGIPLDPRRALAALARGARRRIDAGTAGGRFFLNVASAGFDAEVAAAYHRRGIAGRRRGIFHYVQLGLRLAPSYRARHWVLESDGGRFEGRALVVAVLNGRQYGSGARLAPGARIDDGLLDVVIVEDGPVLESLAAMPLLFAGTVERFRRYRRFTATRAVLSSRDPEPFQRDGEADPAVMRIEIAVLPAALDIVVPPETLEDREGPFSRR